MLRLWEQKGWPILINVQLLWLTFEREIFVIESWRQPEGRAVGARE